MTQDEVLSRFDDLRTELGDAVYGKTMRQNELVDSIQQGILILKFGKIEDGYKNNVIGCIDRQITKLENMILEREHDNRFDQ